MITADQFQSRIKACLGENSAIWAESKLMAHDHRLAVNEAVQLAVRDNEAKHSIKAAKEASKAPKSKRMTDEELAEAIDIMICNKVLDGSISAAEIAQLKDIRNIKLKDRDVVINVVSYKDILI
jgi:hypothetical protein